MVNIFNGSTIPQGHKEKRGLLFIEEIFSGDPLHRAPIALRKRMSIEDLEDIELRIKCSTDISLDSKIVFKDYKHFRKILEEKGIKLREYFK